MSRAQRRAAEASRLREGRRRARAARWRSPRAGVWKMEVPKIWGPEWLRRPVTEFEVSRCGGAGGWHYGSGHGWALHYDGQDGFPYMEVFDTLSEAQKWANARVLA